MVEPKACTSLLPPITVDNPAVSFTVLPTPATKVLYACTLLDVPKAWLRSPATVLRSPEACAMSPVTVFHDPSAADLCPVTKFLSPVLKAASRLASSVIYSQDCSCWTYELMLELISLRY